MGNNRKYKIALIVLSVLLIVQGAWLIHFWQISRHKLIKAKPRVSIKGRIAIVLDDWGYNLNNLKSLSEIKYPLTLSVLPNLPYSNTIAQQALSLGYEVILHLPMEPIEKYRLEKNTILTSMNEADIRNIVDADLNNLKGVKGVSNHMGSKATDDMRTMTVIFGELKKRGLYYLDSFVSPDSVCLELAHKKQLAFARRDVFIDNKEDPDYIKSQIHKLKERARIYGQAIGIGHDRKVTIEVLKEAMPQLEKEGYRFVFVSDLVK
ncbi:MAG: divergent polysaccharide deacetylase family protein [Candidatus Omnitrophica bacterium]|nr:divergent polysaccharide deacetylase family protein [Candidatus Omnitrophota bacterium]